MPEITFNIRVSDQFAKRYMKVWEEVAVRRRVASGAAQAVKRVTETVLPRLQIEAPARNGLMRVRWKSERQRIRVIAYLKETGNYPYQRTRAMVEGWRVRYEASKGKGSLGSIFVSNTAQAENAEGQVIHYYPYVIGDSGSPRAQQPFHADTGWYRLADVVAGVRADVQREVGKVIARAAAGAQP